MTEILGVVLALPGAVAAGFGIYLATLAIASAGWRPSDRMQPGGPKNELVVLVPAHDEEGLIVRCIESLLAQDYPRNLYRVVVIADNCRDHTASVAEGAGAEVMIRNEPDRPGKGRALRWAIDRLLASSASFDAVVVVDADSLADVRLLSSLEAEMRMGSPVVQGDYSVLLDEASGRRTKLVAVAFLLFHRVRFRGRARLGMSANLVGNGMLFSRRVLQEHPWNAFTSVEDLENSINLRLAGIPIRFAPHAFVSGPAATTRAGEVRQRSRWEGGRFHLVRTRLFHLVRVGVTRRDLGVLDAALDLATPPVGLLSIAVGGGLAAACLLAVTRLSAPWAAIPWLIAALSIPLFVAVGLRSAQAPAPLWRAIASAPAYLAWKLVTYASLARAHDPNRWGESDRKRGSSSRVEIAGVPIDSVDMRTALCHLREALGGRKVYQVSTVNLDFLVRAQRDSDVLDIFRRTDLNVADGAPVVWLSKLVGARLPGRVAGADLIPAMLRELSTVNGSVFLLGGEGGVAELAAARITSLYPGVRVVGTYEPPRAAIGDMDNAEILRRIAEAQPDVLLVALGHPKQERWIDVHREQLPVSIAIGVGCVLDMIAGHAQRAPVWMQAAGLEWFYRMLNEPRRLAGRYALDAAWLVPLAAKTLRVRLSGATRIEPA